MEKSPSRTLRPQTDWLLQLPAPLRFFLFRLFIALRHGYSLLLFFVVDVAALALVRRGNSDAVVVIKYDALGDYILFRNFLAALRERADLQGRPLVFCGTSAAREMAETFDRALVGKFIWLENFGEGLDPVRRFLCLRRLKRLGAAVTLQPLCWRGFMTTDALTRATGAPARIGWAVAPSGKTWGEKTGWINWTPALFQTWGDRCYTHLLPTPPGHVFEFERNRLFFQAVLADAPLPRRPELAPLPVDLPGVPRPFALLLPGAGLPIKEWPAENFGRLARHLYGRRGLYIVVAGTARDAGKAQRIEETASLQDVADLTGRLSLGQLTALAAQAALVVANDSAGIHLAAALRRKGVGISSGLGLIDFHPYPPEMDPTVRFVYPRAVRDAASFEVFLEQSQSRPRLSAADVRLEDVIVAVDAILAVPEKPEAGRASAV